MFCLQPGGAWYGQGQFWVSLIMILNITQLLFIGRVAMHIVQVEEAEDTGGSGDMHLQ